MSSFYALVIGASSTIAQAAIQQFEKNQDCLGVFAISRSLPAEIGQENDQSRTNKVHRLVCDNVESSIADICQQLASYSVNITKVLICNGLLHNETMMPEKKLEDINAAQLEAVFHANTVVPMLWLSKLLPILKGKKATQVAVFSARVGSISDNQSGGWYSYRASKAALNMLVQNSAIEYARRAKNVQLIAFHPGTTDTPLSKPFQRGVPEGKLFTADFVASQLLNIMDSFEMTSVETNSIEIKGKAAFLDWNNQAIDW
ncbi:short-chain dehydrogenase [Marinomonas ushuaiensis DSM 15871]|uniref:Short-chain dehydrogenase n=1 Tax=Marinomonas ushuaiensis DSM 15871 TaxID=1122207 RepID=X7E4G7_9GAMM|nr:SDR family NAD(P)-dependent oxidoreductase [Marinomonas ushuaiensis]ETX10061.1 short-chain dehydrogenase [Marinomonas ushuaiensis DSM 15871]